MVLWTYFGDELDGFREVWEVEELQQSLRQTYQIGFHYSLTRTVKPLVTTLLEIVEAKMVKTEHFSPIKKK